MKEEDYDSGDAGKDKGTYEVKGIGEGMGGCNRAPGQSTNVIADRENLFG